MKQIDYDLIIVGGGPAGLTAGLYTSRASLKTLLLEKIMLGGQAIYTERIENYPGLKDGISGLKLMQQMEEQAKGFGLLTQTVEVEGIEPKDYLKVLTVGGKELTTRTVIIATGAFPHKLQVVGEEEFSGRGVSYCATCDGFFFQNSIIAVVGGGDAAAEEALFLTKFASKVYVIHRREKLRATKILQGRLFANPKVEIIWDSVVERIEGDQKVNSLDLKNVKTGAKSKLKVDGVFMYVGITPNTQWLKGVVDLNEQGFIVTKDNMETSVPGIFAAGDVREKLFRQISTAVGDGATAAFAAERYIENRYR